MITGKDGVTYYYNAQTYKYVPSGYTLTEEDKSGISDGSLEVSEGTDNYKESNNQFLGWEKDGIVYMLYGENLDLDEDELIEMAEAL